MTTITILPKTGAVGETPQQLQADIIAGASALNPGLTANLPGTLIEDIASTDAAAVYLSQQAMIETIASVSPLAANQYLLNMLGQIYGVQQGVGSNTSAYVEFSGTPGYVIPIGTIVSDGTYQYIIQDPGVITSSGTSASIYCVATVSGTWAVPANSITTIVSSVPAGVSLTVTNPLTGIPSTSAQDPESYRNQVLQAGLVNCTGTATAVKSALQEVQGVVPTLISVQQAPVSSSGGTNDPIYWQIIVGGGDQYSVANAIYNTIGDPNILTGSELTVTNITKANPGVVTTGILHQYTTGDTVVMTEVLGMTSVNGVTYTVTVLSPYTFSVGVNTSSYGTYTGGGICTPNPRNTVVTINSPPDQYQIPYIIPPQQSLSLSITWATTVLTAISDAVIAQYASQSIANYINAIGPGTPVNFYEIQSIFQTAIVDIVPTETLITILIEAEIDGTPVSPAPSEYVIYGDPQGYFYCALSDISYTQG